MGRAGAHLGRRLGQRQGQHLGGRQLLGRGTAGVARPPGDQVLHQGVEGAARSSTTLDYFDEVPFRVDAVEYSLFPRIFGDRLPQSSS